MTLIDQGDDQMDWRDKWIDWSVKKVDLEWKGVIDELTDLINQLWFSTCVVGDWIEIQFHSDLNLNFDFSNVEMHMKFTEMGWNSNLGKCEFDDLELA